MRALGYLIFFASGFASLVYQIVWQRLLAIFSGSDVHSATIIVAAFMAGLGCGSLAGGHIADRLPRWTAFASFAAAELAIAVFGFFSAELYYDGLYRHLGHTSIGLGGRSAVLFASLLLPTFLMGVSLPLLARALTGSIGHAARVVGWLYAWNTAGAAVGAFAATWVLLPRLGLGHALDVSAAVNLLAAAGAVPLALWARRTPVETASPSHETPTSMGPGHHPPTSLVGWALMYALSGFLALSLEIVWIRLLGVMLKATTFTFGTLLSIYLSGIGLGAAGGALVVRRVREPAHVFVLLQAGIAVYTGLSITLLFGLLNRGGAPSLLDYFGGYESLDVGSAIAAMSGSAYASELASQFALLYVALPFILIGPPTLLMGASFPLLQKAAQTDLARIGARVGGLFAANIVGSTLGSIVTGWVLLGWLETSGTLVFLVAAAAVFPLCALAASWPTSGWRRRLTYATTLGSVALVAPLMPDSRALWALLHGSQRARIIASEDGSGLSVLRLARGAQPNVVVFVNGLGQSWLPYGRIHTALGALPAFIHPSPRDAAVIGLGSGDTLFAIAGRPEIVRITSIEIIKPQLGTLRQLHKMWPYAGLGTVLTDPRITHRQGDGRLHLASSGSSFDVIQADALRPTSAYSGHLYSEEYFALLRHRLKSGGLAVSWSPTPRVHDTFVKVFPHVLSYGEIVLGSNELIAFDADTIRERIAAPQVDAYYRGSGIDIQALLEPYLNIPPRTFTPTDDRSALVDINTDLYPKDEFGVPFRATR